MTGKQYSRILKPTDETLRKVRERLGDLEPQFRDATGYGFDALTESEARTLATFRPLDAVRARIIEEGHEGKLRRDEAPSPTEPSVEEGSPSSARGNANITPPVILESKPSPFADKPPASTKEWRDLQTSLRETLLEDFQKNGPIELPEGSTRFDESSNINRSNLSPEDQANHQEAGARLRELLENSAPPKTEVATGGGASHLHHRYAWMTFADGKVRPIAITLKQWTPETGKTGNSISAFEVGPVIDAIGKTPEQAFLSGIKPEHQPERADVSSVWSKNTPPLVKRRDSASWEPDYGKAEAKGIERFEIDSILNESRTLSSETLKSNPDAYGMGAVLIKGDHKEIGFSSLVRYFEIEELEPRVRKALKDVPVDDRAPFHSRCAEVWAISEMLKAGEDPQGALIVATGIGGTHQGLVRDPCDSCRPVLKHFGVRYLESKPDTHRKDNTHE